MDILVVNKQLFSGIALVPITLPNWRVVDTDEEEDWLRAEFAFQALRASRTTSSQQATTIGSANS